MKKTIVIECSECGGTGLYCGCAESKGTAVVCVRCDGTGKVMFSYNEFEGRKGRKGIHTVSRSRGNFILSCGAVGASVTYEQFQNGVMPK